MAETTGIRAIQAERGPLRVERRAGAHDAPGAQPARGSPMSLRSAKGPPSAPSRVARLP